MTTTKAIGDRGEAIAQNYLRDKGYTILATNYRYQKAEVDIIAETDAFLVFVEVKTRASNPLQAPEEAVNAKKQKLLLQAANAYIEENDLDKEVRFDVLSVIMNKHSKPEIRHIEGAFVAGV